MVERFAQPTSHTDDSDSSLVLLQEAKETDEDKDNKGKAKTM